MRKMVHISEMADGEREKYEKYLEAKRTSTIPMVQESEPLSFNEWVEHRKWLSNAVRGD
jgi:hypothetical protein